MTLAFFPTCHRANQGENMEGKTAQKVYILHRHDEETKMTVAKFIENLGLKPTVLDKKPSKGQTVIDKFDEQADKAGFAIALLTPDDVGALKDEADRQLNPRACQNVIFELGYFIAKLNPNRVCLLYKEGIELPSGIRGIAYVPMDSADAWKLKLSQGMQKAGLPIDMNKLF